MPEDYLIGLDSPGVLERIRVGVEHLDALEESLDHAQQTFDREVRKAAVCLGGSANEAYEFWRLVCRAVVAGSVDLVHQKRARFLELLRGRAEVLKRVCQAAQRARKTIPEVDELLSEVVTIDRLYDRLNRRWQDADSLEYLVAEEIGPSSEELKAMAARNPPPQAWYDQDDDPFQE